jgi:hypothetical protein
LFWSPDSRFIAFDAAGQVKKIDVRGGAPQKVCDLPTLAVGGAWNRDDVIIVGNAERRSHAMRGFGRTRSPL